MFNSNILFYLSSIFLVVSSSLVILAQHSVFSLIFLVISFLCSSFLLFMLECEFLGLLFILVYVGAIAILFLFSIMMLESKQSNLSRNTTKYVPVGILFGVSLFWTLFFEISSYFGIVHTSDTFHLNIYQNWYDLIDSFNDLEVYAQVLYSFYVVHFLISGFILLLILIGVVYLTNVLVIPETLEQSLFKQLSRYPQSFLND